MKLEEMSVEQLETLLEGLDRERESLRRRAKEIMAVRNAKIREREIAAKLGLQRLKPGEEAVAQRILAGAVEIGVEAQK